MKRIYAVLLLFIMILFMSACSQDTTETSESRIENSSSETQEEVLVPVYADEIKDGSYEITVDSSSSMFRVVECVLNVEGGEMSAVMTMSGQGYGFVYMGTGEEASADTEDSYIPFVMNDNEQKTFTVPIEALDLETDCAAWSIRKERWYDRTLVFEADNIPEEALISE